MSAKPKGGGVASNEPIRVLGVDASLNHGAAFLLEGGKPRGFWYYTDIAGSAARSKQGHRLPVSKSKDQQQRQMARLAWLEHFWDKLVFMKCLPHYLVVEDYALDVSQGSHYMGEIGGIIRILGWFRGFRIRLHDPVTLKMWTAHNGLADKPMMEAAVKERFGLDFSRFNPPPPKPNARVANPKQNRTTSEDLADAAALAHLGWQEVQLRAGQVLLRDLHAKEVQVYNRMTKARPVPLLDRDWIHNPEGTPTPHGEPVCAVCGSRKCCLAKKGKAK
jgi:hypothetical protein